MGRIVRGSDCYSQRLDPFLRGQTERFWVWSDCPTPVGSDCLNMKTFVGRIVTVSDGAGWSVTVSKQPADGVFIKAPICLLVFTFTLACLLGVVRFCRNVQCTYVRTYTHICTAYGVQLSNKVYS